jgi:hypothetical protein
MYSVIERTPWESGSVEVTCSLYSYLVDISKIRHIVLDVVYVSLASLGPVMVVELEFPDAVRQLF